MMYPQYYGAQLVPHSPATPGSMPLFSSSPMTSATGSLLPSPPPPLKRSTSDDSSDDDDSKSLQMADSNMDGNCHMMNRKKRRGLIEKRRRDRINNSLHELKRLVPAAFEKQGSAKLEKAEILQLTVDHLRMLHAKGFDAFSFDPHKFATDYHLIGFRECAAEVARYLVVHEGIDFQDPLRLRLISHMQCYSAQRELSLKSSTGWNPSLFTTPMYPAATAPTASSSSTVTASSTTTSASASTNTSAGLGGSAESMSSLTNSGSSSSSQHHSSQYAASSSTYPHYSQLESSMMTANAASSSSMSCNSSSHSSQSAVKQESSTPSGSGPSAFSTVPGYSSMAAASSSSYSYSYPTGTYFGPTPASYMAPMMPTSQSTSSNSQNSVKHYRPWGTELAY